MERCAFRTPQGDITYWVSRKGRPDKPWLIFLPGLTADHRLFEPQIAAFEGKANLLVWDAPSHGESRPFELAWTLDDLARWLHGILGQEGIERPILVGQSMGGATQPRRFSTSSQVRLPVSSRLTRHRSSAGISMGGRSGRCATPVSCT